MRRGAVMVLVVVLAAAGGVAGWRALQLGRDLDDARRDLVAVQASQAATIREQDERLRKSGRRVKSLTQDVRRLRSELRDRQRCPGYPRLILSPDSGPPGTRVDFAGYCFVGDYGIAHLRRFDIDPLTGGYGLFLMNPAQDLSEPGAVSNGGPECELIAGTEPHDLAIHRDGTAEGYLTIPTSGACFQEDRDEVVSPGEYDVGLQCHACAPLAIFRVTS
jgi:hypothetical protein